MPSPYPGKDPSRNITGVDGISDGILNGMRTTIDKAGRIVVPKAMRDAMGLTAGGKVDIAFVDGKIEIEPAYLEAHVEMRDGLPVIVLDEDAPPIDADVVRDTIEAHRKDRIDHLAHGL